MSKQYARPTRKRNTADRKTVVISMEPDLRRGLGIAAMAHGTTISGLVRSVCHAYLNQKSTRDKMQKFIDLCPDMDIETQ